MFGSSCCSDSGPGKVLQVYGPGGPFPAVKECSNIFMQKFSVPINVIKGPPDTLATRIAENGDIFYAGAENMMIDFIKNYPGVIDTSSIINLYPRQVGIIIRSGNSKKIKSIKDLRNDKINILDVRLENMSDLRGDVVVGKNNVLLSVITGEEGLAAWKTHPELDAWVTYKSWHVQLHDDSEFISIRGSKGRRYTPVALTSNTKQHELAQSFLYFLKTGESHNIFRKYGWD